MLKNYNLITTNRLQLQKLGTRSLYPINLISFLATELHQISPISPSPSHLNSFSRSHFPCLPLKRILQHKFYHLTRAEIKVNERFQGFIAFRGSHTFYFSRFSPRHVQFLTPFLPQLTFQCSGKRVNWELYNFLLCVSCDEVRYQLQQWFLFVCSLIFIVDAVKLKFRTNCECVSYRRVGGRS
jgi:hypothetical protein